MRPLLLATILYLATGCATLVNGERQQVFFRGGPEKGVTKVQTPDGTFEVENGSGSYLMTRSRANIPMKVTCPDGSVKSSVIETRFDWLLGGAGNILNGGWGWIVDPFVGDAYNIENVSLSTYCGAKSDPVAH